MDLARAPRRARLTARKKGSGYENARQYTILDVFAFSCPVPAAELCIVEWRFLVGGDFGIPGGSLSIQVRL